MSATKTTTDKPFVGTTPTDRSGAYVVDKPVELHAPELYDAACDAEPLDGLGSIGPAEVERYHRDGYLAVENVFTAEEVEAAKAGLWDLVMGKVAGFEGITFEAGMASRPGGLEGLTREERFDAVRKLWAFRGAEPRLAALCDHAGLLGVICRLMGGKTPAMFQDMALLKPPGGREKPWHQDHAYFDFPVGTPVVGVWIALDAATRANGCMHMLAGGHKQGPRLHFQRRDWQICDLEMMGVKSVAVPLKPGGLLLFDGLVPHGTPYNPSRERRRAAQFHYAPAGTQKTGQAERLAVFGAEGKDVTC